MLSKPIELSSGLHNMDSELIKKSNLKFRLLFFFQTNQHVMTKHIQLNFLLQSSNNIHQDTILPFQ